MTKDKDTDNELGKAPHNNPVYFDRSQMIRDIMDVTDCDQAEAEEFLERLLATARKRNEK